MGLLMTYLIAHARRLLVLPVLAAALSLATLPARADMVPLADELLAEVTGQALFVADKIEPNSLLGQLGAGSSTDFTFFRIGMDVELAVNMNMTKLQLGCGGVNDGLDNTVCDIDFDYVRFMGRSGTAAGAVGSSFVLRRPYLEFAIKNFGSLTGREVAGIKIGAQSADGFVGVGRRYGVNNSVNQERGGPNCLTGASTGNGVAGCSSGVNSLSGFLGAELSAQFPANLEVWPLTFNSTLCAGYYPAQADCNNPNNRLFADLAGTRIKRLDAKGMEVFGDGIVDLLGGSGYAWLTADLSLLHGFAMTNTQDFFLSFQRESISWPRYSKTAPPANGTDACNPVYSPPAPPGRCASAYAFPSNTGWWMNVPDAKLLNVQGDSVTISGLGNVLAALGYPGYRITNADLNIPVAVNCYGQRAFC